MIFTIERIQNTKTYKGLKAKKETIKCNFLENKSVRERITNAYNVFDNTGKIPDLVTCESRQVVIDLIEESQKNDASRFMSCENINL